MLGVALVVGIRQIHHLDQEDLQDRGSFLDPTGQAVAEVQGMGFQRMEEKVGLDRQNHHLLEAVVVVVHRLNPA
jgi:hypothetical protein